MEPICVAFRRILCYSVNAAPLRPIFYGKEVRSMETILNFLLSVVAGVAADAICKWLDEQFRSGKH
ncbi:hypothetical protein C4N23_06730 [Faecalibacterium hattorii]|uniref:Uncharacterized protein n=1 Tax=Faecalibacterium hattorii TaxID=2935520 RepID=A0A329UMW0_9FIRM|nr:hypothetical protein C4N23_06730 [Faecalibacterium hattorii]